ncbi:phosphatase PAP2 family protein [Bifidobacterium subtile]|jgi:membrane-associated phospholipid phosphatase|uniref:phosphatase PAP2 family protein n=1 Tax=Bifidobacterium subtile TaxID=77635 RepID=UPI002F35EB40
MSDETESEFEPDAATNDAHAGGDVRDNARNAEDADADTPDGADDAADTTTADVDALNGEHADGSRSDDEQEPDRDAAAQANSSPGAPMPVFTPLPEPATSPRLSAAAEPSNYESPADAGTDSLHPLETQGSLGAQDGRNQADDLSGLAGPQGQSAALPGDALPGDLDYDLDHGLARLDPLTVRPRISSRVLCAVFGLVFAALAAGVWWLGVRTMNGQNYDEIVYNGLSDSIAVWFRPVTDAFTNSYLVIRFSVAIIVVAALVAALRRRWWLLAQLAAVGLLFWGVHYLKDVLPRPFIGNILSSQKNSAPSGHTLLAAAAGVLLLIAVGRAWRALVALVASIYAVLVGLSVIVGGWHRPTDVAMAILLIGAVTLLALVFTGKSGMDEPGRRASSPSVQIVASVMITLGVLGSLYAGYIIWQLDPGLALSERWTHGGAIVSAVVLISAASALVFGLVLAMRQLTASPLSRFGLVGAPPEPPTPPAQSPQRPPKR